VVAMGNTEKSSEIFVLFCSWQFPSITAPTVSKVWKVRTRFILTFLYSFFFRRWDLMVFYISDQNILDRNHFLQTLKKYLGGICPRHNVRHPSVLHTITNISTPCSSGFSINASKPGLWDLTQLKGKSFCQHIWYIQEVFSKTPHLICWNRFSFRQQMVGLIVICDLFLDWIWRYPSGFKYMYFYIMNWRGVPYNLLWNFKGDIWGLWPHQNGIWNLILRSKFSIKVELHFFFSAEQFVLVGTSNHSSSCKHSISLEHQILFLKFFLTESSIFPEATFTFPDHWSIYGVPSKGQNPERMLSTWLNTVGCLNVVVWLCENLYVATFKRNLSMCYWIHPSNLKSKFSKSYWNTICLWIFLNAL
jgi:hypothetical protein